MTWIPVPRYPAHPVWLLVTMCGHSCIWAGICDPGPVAFCGPCSAWRHIDRATRMVMT